MWVCSMTVLSALHFPFGFQCKTVRKGKGAAEVRVHPPCSPAFSPGVGQQASLSSQMCAPGPLRMCGLSCKAEKSAYWD